jgi:hypothetical protein
MNQPVIRFGLMVVIMVICIARGSSQTAMPEIFEKGNIKDQMKYIEEKTLIYENFRAIHEDIFQKMKNNAIDSLTKAKSSITGYIGFIGSLNVRIDSLNNILNATKENLKKLTTTKNSISVIGMEVDKTSYNSIMWTIMAVLAFLLAIGYLAFKRFRTITLNTKKELKELREEFEGYRQKSRIEREKVSMDHFNEIKKLKGG